MNKGAVTQGTKDEKNNKQKQLEENFQSSSKRFQLFGKNDNNGGQPKVEKMKRTKQLRSAASWDPVNGKSARDFQFGRTKRKKL